MRELPNHIRQSPFLGLLVSMAIRQDHAFFVDEIDIDESGQIITKPKSRNGLIQAIISLHQILEEAMQEGFWRPEIDEVYRNMLWKALEIEPPDDQIQYGDTIKIFHHIVDDIPSGIEVTLLDHMIKNRGGNNSWKPYWLDLWNKREYTLTSDRRIKKTVEPNDET